MEKYQSSCNFFVTDPVLREFHLRCSEFRILLLYLFVHLFELPAVLCLMLEGTVIQFEATPS